MQNQLGQPNGTLSQNKNINTGAGYGSLSGTVLLYHEKSKVQPPVSQLNKYTNTYDHLPF